MAALLAAAALTLLVPTAFAQGGGAGGAGGGAGGASSGATSGTSGSAGAGNTSAGNSAPTGASSANTVGQVKTISPSNPATTEPGGANALPVPNGTVTQQNAQQFDPRLSPGYQK
jgi:hypothetical protein